MSGGRGGNVTAACFFAATSPYAAAAQQMDLHGPLAIGSVIVRNRKWLKQPPRDHGPANDSLR